jgi:hypothetical protein
MAHFRIAHNKAMKLTVASVTSLAEQGPRRTRLQLIARPLGALRKTINYHWHRLSNWRGIEDRS